MSITLYGSPLSPFVRKTLVTLQHKGIPFQWEKTDPFNPPADFRDISPLGRIPALTHGEVALADSAVICQYLERAFPETPRLYPLDAVDYARTLWFEKYVDYELATHCTAPLFQQRCLMPLLGKPTDDNKVQHALSTTLPPMLDYLERALSGRSYLVGDTLTLADIALASQLVNLGHAGETLDENRWPSLANFQQRLHALSPLAATIAQERAFLHRALKKN